MAAPEDLPDQQSQRRGADLTFVIATNRYPTTNLHRTIPKTFKAQFVGGLARDPSLATII